MHEDTCPKAGGVSVSQVSRAGETTSGLVCAGPAESGPTQFDRVRGARVAGGFGDPEGVIFIAGPVAVGEVGVIYGTGHTIASGSVQGDGEAAGPPQMRVASRLGHLGGLTVPHLVANFLHKTFALAHTCTYCFVRCCKTCLAHFTLSSSQEGGWVDALVEGIVVAINLLMEITIPPLSPKVGGGRGLPRKPSRS